MSNILSKQITKTRFYQSIKLSKKKMSKSKKKMLKA